MPARTVPTPSAAPGAPKPQIVSGDRCEKAADCVWDKKDETCRAKKLQAMIDSPDKVRGGKSQGDERSGMPPLVWPVRWQLSGLFRLMGARAQLRRSPAGSCPALPMQPRAPLCKAARPAPPTWLVPRTWLVPQSCLPIPPPPQAKQLEQQYTKRDPAIFGNCTSLKVCGRANRAPAPLFAGEASG
jgi:hypothetical protein